jgi:hypothetical protein
MFDTRVLSRRRLDRDDLKVLGVECELGFFELAAELSSVPSNMWTVFIPRARLVITRYKLGMQAAMILRFIIALDASH